MAHELRILAVLPLGDDQMANGSVMHKLAPAVEAFKKAVLALSAEAAVDVNLVRVRAPKLTVVAKATDLQPSTEPPEELKLEQPTEATKPIAAALGGAAPWKRTQGEAA
jgi:hypothetical protein